MEVQKSVEICQMFITKNKTISLKIVQKDQLIYQITRLNRFEKKSNKKRKNI